MADPRPAPAAPTPVAPPPDVFDGFFRTPRAPAPPGSLLDHPGARSWLALIGWGMERGLYTFQQPLEGRSGPHVTVAGRSLLMLSSYDYLGLIGHPAIERAAVEAIRRYGSGSGGVRLLTGTTTLHRELERDLAAFKGTEVALVFSSGYAAALGALTALLGPRDLAVLDERAHRSVVDGCHLARVPVRRFRHNDPEALDAVLAGTRVRGRTLVVVDGTYSMDGDVCPLPDVVAASRRHGAYVMVDEAHSFGVLGGTGRGVDEHFGMRPGDVDLWLGSLSKAIPANGGFLAGARELLIYLQHAAAPFMFSAALCPAAAAAARAALRVIDAEPWRIARVARTADLLRDGLRDRGFDTGSSATCIIPVVVGRDDDAYALSRALLDEAVLACAVVPPAVPAGAARLRLCATAAHGEEDVAAALDAFQRVRGRGARGS